MVGLPGVLFASSRTTRALHLRVRRDRPGAAGDVRHRVPGSCPARATSGS